MSTRLLSEEERFSENAAILASILCAHISSLQKREECLRISPMYINLIPTLVRNYDKRNLIRGFIENCQNPAKNSGCDVWERIRLRDKQFFIDNADEIFIKKLPVENIGIFRELFAGRDKEGRPLVGEEILADIWKSFSGMVKIALKYIHRERKPTAYYNEEDKASYRYTLELYDFIDVPQLARLWDIKLTI